MLSLAFGLARPFLFGFAPEQAHEMTLRALETGLYPRPFTPDDTRLGGNRCRVDVEVAGEHREAKPDPPNRGRTCAPASITIPSHQHEA